MSHPQKPALREGILGERELNGYASVVHEVHDVLALPDCPVFVPNRHSFGAFWDPAREDIVLEALSAVAVLPERKDVEIDRDWLLKALETAPLTSIKQDQPCIYGGVLIRHFGHFFHESLSRLWWLGSVEAMPIRLQSAAASLQSLNSDVCFFMPPWSDRGKDLTPYMEEILAGLGLKPERVRIISEPTHFQRILVPFQPWGFCLNPSRVDELYGCDSLQLMRNLMASYGAQKQSALIPADRATACSPITNQAKDTPLRVFVSRSALPLDLGRLIGDVILDQVLAEAGYLIFHPENHSISEQIALYSSADELVFIDGSSLYLLWISHLRPKAKIQVIVRRRQGEWMSARIKDLLPGETSLRWEVINALIGEEVTSDKDWLSHNLVDMRAVLQRILGRAPAALSPDARKALQAYATMLIAQTQPEQQAAVLQTLMEAMVIAPYRAQESGRERLKLKLTSISHRARSMLRAFFKRHPSS